MRAFALPISGPLRQRAAVPLVLAAVIAAGWAATLRLGGTMDGHAAHAGIAASFAMWAAMAVAMMVPIEAPSVVRLARGATPLADAASFLCGYLVPWFAFSLGAAVLQQRLHAAGLVDAHMAASNRAISAALLGIAAIVQLSPLRKACVDRCREAASNGGLGGGLRRGFSSIACCGVLMLVPFAAGGMSVSWMAALTVLLVAERELPRASRLGAVAGVLLIGLAGWTLVG